MEPKNVMLLGFVNKAVEYLDKHIDDEKMSASLTELKNTDLASLKKELNKEIDSSLGTMQSTIDKLLKAGGDAFDDFVENEVKEEEITDDIDKIFDIDLKNVTTSGKSDTSIKDLFALYEKDNKEVEKTEDTAKEEPEEETAEEETAEEETPYVLSAEENELFNRIIKNVSRRSDEEAKNEKIGVTDKELDLIFSEVMSNKDELSEIKDIIDEPVPKKVEEPVVEEKPVKEELQNKDVMNGPENILIEPASGNMEDFITDNPLVGMNTDDDLAGLMDELDANLNKNGNTVKEPEQVDKDDIIKLVEDIQSKSDVYYNRVSFDDEDDSDDQLINLKDSQKQDLSVNTLIDDLRDQMLKEDRRKQQIEDEYRQVYERIHKSYPYLSSSFIKSVYELKESINWEYPNNARIIILHRTVFKNVENLRQFVEIALNHGYSINADEKKMIVDVFKQHVNTDGKIVTSIFEVANQSALLNGEYEGYRVMFEDKAY
ncbi:MAG: hypothetical protein IK151_03670 [Erysipelotrichaceae bacterium]|nr:hypothetical protein [Erysipelotrichaceae bacterium]